MPDGNRERYRCPFAPCHETWWRSPGAPFMTPVHDVLLSILTEATAPEECPGSRMVLRNGEPDAQAKIYLDRAQRSWDDEITEQGRRNKVMPTDPATGFLGFPLGKRPHGVDGTAFPPRAGDPGAPEEEWKPQPKTLPMDQIGEPLGRAAVSNAHATTRQLLTLTEQKLDEAIGALGKLPDICDVLDGIVTQVSVHIDAAAALATATVGDGIGAPIAAHAMVAHIRDAKAKASIEDGGELQAALVLFVRTSTEITQMIAAAQTQAQAYHATLRGGS